jgi:hypothetical protein
MGDPTRDRAGWQLRHGSFDRLRMRAARMASALMEQQNLLMLSLSKHEND